MSKANITPSSTILVIGNYNSEMLNNFIHKYLKLSLNQKIEFNDLTFENQFIKVQDSYICSDINPQSYCIIDINHVNFEKNNEHQRIMMQNHYLHLTLILTSETMQDIDYKCKDLIDYYYIIGDIEKLDHDLLLKDLHLFKNYGHIVQYYRDNMIIDKSFILEKSPIIENFVFYFDQIDMCVKNVEQLPLMSSTIGYIRNLLFGTSNKKNDFNY